MKTQEIGQSGMIASRVALGVMRMDALDAADAARTVAVAQIPASTISTRRNAYTDARR